MIDKEKNFTIVWFFLNARVIFKYFSVFQYSILIAEILFMKLKNNGGRQLFFVPNSFNNQRTSAISVFWFYIQTINKKIIFCTKNNIFLKIYFYDS
jgi:hypothetical protein